MVSIALNTRCSWAVDTVSSCTGGYVLATIHRPENTDTPNALRRILTALAELPIPVVLVAHPRTLNAAHRFGLSPLLQSIKVRESVSHSEFLALAASADLLISDSAASKKMQPC